MIGDIRTGLISSADGAKNEPRGSQQGGLVIQSDGGKYEEPAIRQQMCFSYCAARATSVPATAQIGNIIWNPPGSGVVLVMCKWSIQIQATSATTLGITFGYGAQATTPTTVTVANAYGSTYLNAGSPGNCKAKAYAIATLGVAPTPVMNLVHNTAAIATTGVDSIQGDFDGIWIIPPGYVGALSAITAAIAAAGMTSTLTWKEMKI